MTVCPAPAREVVKILEHVDDPLPVAAAIAARAESAVLRQDIMAGAVNVFGRRVTARALHALSRYAREAATHGEAAAEAERLLSIPTFAAHWLGARLLESCGRHERAAAVLLALTDVDWTEPRALRLTALARNLMAAGRPSDAWHPLRHAARAAASHQSAGAVGRLLTQAARSSSPQARVQRRVAIVGTGTLQLWADALKAALFGAGVWADLFVGAFGQYRQEILGDASPLAAFNPEVILLAIDYRSLGVEDMSPDPDRTVAGAIAGLQGLWEACHARFSATVIQLNFEVPEVDPLGRLSAATMGGRSRILQRVNLDLWDAAAKANVALFDLNEAAATFGKHAWQDAAMWLAARQYPAAEALPLVARRLAALVRAASGLTSKCLVLDLDGTLWGGIVGEDGLSGIRLGGDGEGEAYTAFHRYILGLKRRGIALAVCSKNNPSEALAVFREHPDTLLREEDFAVILANWEPKPDNVRRVAAMLDVGLEALVFVDDNPMERDLVRSELPDVEVPELPDDPALFPECLHRTYLFESVTFTDEDRFRADSYRDNAERAQFAASTVDLDQYLLGLEMAIELRPFDDQSLPRVVQLINKTNQFNLTTRKATATDVKRWMHHPHCYTQCMRLRDRFGDSGLTGVLVAFRDGDSVRIDNWLLSCRVLGRRVENAMLRSAIAYARATGARRLIGEYVPTQKNVQVAGLYERFGFAVERRGPEGAAMYALHVDTATDPAVQWFRIEDSTLTHVLERLRHRHPAANDEGSTGRYDHDR